MAYGRKSNYRRYRRGGYKRSALSTRKIFSRTSAKAQANQIYALRKSVSRIKRHLRPEVYTNSIQTVQTKSFSNSAIGDSYWSYHYSWPSNGTGDDAKRGDKIWCKSMQLNFTFEYYNSSDTGYHNSESSGCPVRIIVLKTKQPADYHPPDLSAILVYSNYLGAEYTQRAVSPYVHGITDKYSILYNKVFYMTPEKNQKCMRIFLKPGLIQWETDDTAHQVFVYVIPAGLHSDANFTENILMSFSSRIAYIDF